MKLTEQDTEEMELPILGHSSLTFRQVLGPTSTLRLPQPLRQWTLLHRLALLLHRRRLEMQPRLLRPTATANLVPHCL